MLLPYSSSPKYPKTNDNQTPKDNPTPKDNQATVRPERRRRCAHPPVIRFLLPLFKLYRPYIKLNYPPPIRMRRRLPKPSGSKPFRLFLFYSSAPAPQGVHGVYPRCPTRLFALLLISSRPSSISGIIIVLPII